MGVVKRRFFLFYFAQLFSFWAEIKISRMERRVAALFWWRGNKKSSELSRHKKREKEDHVLSKLCVDRWGRNRIENEYRQPFFSTTPAVDDGLCKWNDINCRKRWRAHDGVSGAGRHASLTIPSPLALPLLFFLSFPVVSSLISHCATTSFSSVPFFVVTALTYARRERELE